MSEPMSVLQLELMGSMLTGRAAAGKGDSGKAEVTSSALGKPPGPWQSPPGKSLCRETRELHKDGQRGRKARPPPWKGNISYLPLGRARANS